MNQRKTVLALLAALALSAFVSASASAALPEFTTKSSFVGSFGSSVFAIGNVYEFAYSGGYFKGQMPTKSTVSETQFAFTGGKKACYTKGEEMVWAALKGRLGYINQAKEEVGLLLGEPITQPIVKCTYMGIYAEEISGALISQITPVNTKTRKFKLKIYQGRGEKEFTKFEGEEAHPLTWSSGQKVGIAVAEVNLTTEVETEIKA